MDAPGRNRLDETASPYLRQHADNPVHWQPWDDDALAAARERDVPIFLSIGYSSCHWCHVMAEESFEDETVAELLNEHYVPIKVDREERPDIDSIYMTICQQVTGGGGWPLSAWLTPEGDPFYVGTYFPKTPRRGMPGFVELLENFATAWVDSREDIERRADQWTSFVAKELEQPPSRSGDPESFGSAMQNAANSARRAADMEHGGFGSQGPKFPQTGRLELLLDAYATTEDATYLDVVTTTLDAMASGGLYDHVGGGFHRYATDREWVVPHFEKMLYDNAQLPVTYLEAYRVTGDDRYARVVDETLAFVERELTHPDGGFYSTLDARSEGKEGRFYVWTPSEIRDAIEDDEVAELVERRYGVTDGGNFEGRTVLTLAEPLDDLGDREAVEERLERAKQQLFDAREERVRPARDEKILGAWNGLMISAFARAGRYLDGSYTDSAVRALEYVRDTLWDGERLARRAKDGDVAGTGYLEDYANLASGAFDVYQTTGRVEPLAFAIDLADVIVEEFWDDEDGTLFFTPASGERLVVRPQDRTDGSTPSATGVALSVLLSLAPFTNDDRYENIVGRTLETHANRIENRPLEHTTLVRVADRWVTGDVELTLSTDEIPDAWRDALSTTYIPNAIVAQRPPTDEGLASWLDALSLDEAPPIWAGRNARNDEPTVYACRKFTCSPPANEIETALDWLAENA